MPNCDGCHACCYLLNIAELDKPAYTTCKFVQIQTGGCSIYNQRPEVCQIFECAYRQNDDWPIEWRPDKLHVMIWEPIQGEHFQIHVDPQFPDAWKQPEAQQIINAFLEQRPIILVSGGMKKILLRGDDQAPEIFRQWLDRLKNYPIKELK